MIDKYQDIIDRERAKLVRIHAKLDKKHKKNIIRIYVLGMFLAVAWYFIVYYVLF